MVVSGRAEGLGCLFVAPEIVKGQCYQLNVRKSMWPDGIHPRVLNCVCYNWTPPNSLPKVLGVWESTGWLGVSQRDITVQDIHERK